MKELLVSKSGTPFPSWMKWFALAVGIFLVADGMRVFEFHKIFVGVVVAFISGYQKRLYVSSEGLVRENGSWFRKYKTVLPWEEIKHVGLVKRGNRMMAFFERDITGWKVLFDAEDEPKLRAILAEYIPDVEIGEVG
ncbi:hypothetical protein Tlie_1390 [Thermovirga lienii DSM 17291]|uniref:Bacterial PH domain-containing protein n=1 Tax=Thermovirga lienii (strain ATCC BAA-1197 / DSM 17291 / Cas60314) TaxID=580340 RepID=G7V6K5_THELD|nr:hypothetical protein [Thermovirga lienii]AER67118.1 hypothetical protein Tlie_1390 [Thermovirga lienii DSM 17291]